MHRLQLFDEILVNAVDHKRRDKSVSRIDVRIRQGTSANDPATITVFNDGAGIPVRKHRKEGVLSPPLLLQLLQRCLFCDN